MNVIPVEETVLAWRLVPVAFEKLTPATVMLPSLSTLNFDEEAT